MFLVFFSQKNGSLECFILLKVFYPVLQKCMDGDTSLTNKDTIFMESDEVSYDNCVRLDTYMMLGVAITQTRYYNYFSFEGVKDFKICFTAEVRNLKHIKNCPAKYKDYQVDERNFWFRVAPTRRVRNKQFFRSPNVQQYEFLMAANFSTFNDNYSYESHKNE